MVISWETVLDPTTYSYLTGSRYLVLAGIALFLAIVLVLMRRRQPGSVSAFTTGTGKILVTRGAILELVQSACEQLPGVRKPRIALRFKRGRTHIDVKLKLLNGGKLTEVSSLLQQHLSKALKDDLGIEKLGDINILVTSFKSGKLDKRESTVNTPRPAQPEAPADASEAMPEADATDDDAGESRPWSGDDTGRKPE